MTPHPKQAGDYKFRPPLFSREEWRRIVAHHMLSDQQAEILGLVIQGKRDKEISKLLGIAIPTVRSHLDECKLRLGVADRTILPYRSFETFRHLFG
jgi:DNA-binding CsgD family transcriptional regulator